MLHCCTLISHHVILVLYDRNGGIILKLHYLLPVADPEHQPGGWNPGVDKTYISLLQVIQGEKVNCPGRKYTANTKTCYF